MSAGAPDRVDDPAVTPLPYDIGGPSAAPVICFLHGTRLTRGMWAAQMLELGDAYRVVAVDLPGHGSEHGRPFTLEHAADHVAEVIRSVAPDGRAVVVGLSLGGYVAMVLAARHRAVVRGLVLSGASAEPVGWRAAPYRWLAAVLERGEGPRLTALNRWFFGARYPAAIAEPILAGGFWSAGGAVALRSLLGRDFVPMLAAYHGPVLLINGEYDLPFRLSSRAFRRALPRARWVRIRGATHLANLDRPRAFSRAVRGFMEALDGADPSRR
jgi:pimeloyl-ACP methyl ester carboxylesterase